MNATERGWLTPVAAHALASLALILDLLALILLIPQGWAVLDTMDGSTIGGYVLGATFPIVGWIIAARRPRNVMGWIFLVIGLSQALDTFAHEYGMVGLVTQPGSLPGADVLAWIGVWSWAPGFTLLLTVGVLLFPDGRLPSRRWRPVPIVAGLALILLIVPIAIAAWQFRGSGLLDSDPVASSDPFLSTMINLQLGGLLLLVVSAIGSVAGLAVRYRCSSGVERAQLKWFAAAGIVEVTLLLVSAFVTLPGLVPNLILTIAIAPLLPIAAGLAILRYHLYDIDRIVSRTVGWVGVTVILVAIFAGAVIGIEDLLAGFTQGQTLAVAASTLVVAAAFQPLRQRVQRAADRRFYRSRYNADQVIAAFVAGLRERVELDAVTQEIGQAARRALDPGSASIWIRETPR